MNADCKGALAQINKSWKAFEHRGKPMSKAEVKAVLQYAIEKGYEHTGMLSDDEVDNILQSTKQWTPVMLGAKIWFAGEKQGYTVKACDTRYAICTKPFNPLRTVLYTIVDFKEGIRGRNNLIFNIYDYKKQEDIDRCLVDLNNPAAGVQVSHRHHVELFIVKIENPKQ